MYSQSLLTARHIFIMLPLQKDTVQQQAPWRRLISYSLIPLLLSKDGIMGYAIIHISHEHLVPSQPKDTLIKTGCVLSSVIPPREVPMCSNIGSYPMQNKLLLTKRHQYYTPCLLSTKGMLQNRSSPPSDTVITARCSMRFDSECPDTTSKGVDTRFQCCTSQLLAGWVITPSKHSDCGRLLVTRGVGILLVDRIGVGDSGCFLQAGKCEVIGGSSGAFMPHGM